jgi:pimeloyl-ACP methyl ester carboxylesterase
MAMTSAPESHAVEVIRAESGRFRHPLLMIHGAWTGGWIWTGLAGYLAHRGWDCWVPTASRATRDARRSALLEIARDLPAPPVLVTHDAGCATALDVAEALAVPAVVAIAPLCRDVVSTGIAAWIASVATSSVPPPQGDALSGLTKDAADRLVPESRSFYRSALAAAQRPTPTTQPRLVVATTDDRLTPPQLAEDFARRSESTFDLYESAGHFPMLETGFERLGDRVHRWIVRTLGERLLAFVDDENQLK